MTNRVGSIVRARGREWVVQPGSTDEMVRVQPLGGNPQESTVILTAVEDVEPASFAPPDPALMGDHQSAWLMRAAARIGNPNATGPFRCLGRIGVQPRPYQYVPLLMALKQEPVRLLIADDVGVGKTVEALLIARELMDRGEIEGFCVLSPPNLLAEQWQAEIKDKVHLDAELYLASTADRIHRRLGVGESPFQHHPVMVASIDYVKQESRRDTFIHHAPRLVIVDEAHTCTMGSDERHLRYELIERLSRDRSRHIILVTATPHTGDEDAFRRLLSLLNPDLESLPSDLTGEHNRRHRERLAGYMVQRRRGDLADYLEGTHFSKLLVKETTYTLHADARELLIEMVEAARSKYDAASKDKEKRVHWWSLLSMVRAFASSPRALAATLRTRNITAATESPEEADKRGQDAMLVEEMKDQVHGAGSEGEYEGWAERADALAGAKDLKLKDATTHLKKLLEQSRGVIVFCQFVDTAEYLAEALRGKLDAEIQHVTGRMDPDDRRARIDELSTHPRRVLVATDCLSTGVNMQDHFDAVVHYDLAWNPTQHEQRDGRVDRYGQKSPEVRSILYYGTDNLIDGIVLEVLLRKHERIRSTTGVRVPVPRNHADVTEAIMESLLLRRREPVVRQATLPSFGDDVTAFHSEWERRGEREKKSRTLFAQATIKDEDVAEAIEGGLRALGADEVERFVTQCLRHSGTGAGVSGVGDAWRITVDGIKDEVRHALDLHEDTLIRFQDDPTKPGIFLHRGHPLVQGLCQYAIETAIDGELEGPAARCSAILTGAVSQPTFVYLARFRYRLASKAADRLIEEVVTYGHVPGTAGLLGEDDLKPHLEAQPDGNLARPERLAAIQRAIDALPDLMPRLRAEAAARCREAQRVHERVRSAASLPMGRISMEVNGEPDILGAYVFLPKEARR